MPFTQPKSFSFSYHQQDALHTKQQQEASGAHDTAVATVVVGMLLRTPSRCGAALREREWLNGEISLPLSVEEAAQAMQESGRRHELSAFMLVSSGDLDSSVSSFFNLSISCKYGSVSIADKTRDLLRETSFACVSNADSTSSSTGDQQTMISAFTTLSEAQRILSSLIYENPAPESCRMPRGTTEDLLTVHIEQLAGGSAMSRWSVEGDVCFYDSVSVLFGQLVSSSASGGQVILERRLILPSDSLLGTQLIQISPENAPTKYTQGVCALLPTIKIDIVVEKVSTQERQYASVHFRETEPVKLVDVKLSARKGTLQLSVASALKNRVRVLGVILDPQTPLASASSFTLQCVLSDLQRFLPTVRYCSSGKVYFASDTVDVDVSFNGMCSALRVDGDLVKAHTSISIPIERMIVLGQVSLLSPVNGGSAAAATNLLILSKNQLFMPLNVQYSPGNVDDITVEMRFTHNDGFGDDGRGNGMLMGVEDNPQLIGATLVPDLQTDVSTYTQTITRTQSSNSLDLTQALAGEPERFSLHSSHGSWFNPRQADLPIAFTEEQLKQALDSLLSGGGPKPSVHCKDDFDTPSLTLCTIEYRDVNLVRVPRIFLASESSPATLTGRLSVSALSEKKPTRTDLQIPDLKKSRKWCGMHVEFPDQKTAAEASFHFTRKICELAQSCRVATTLTFASFASLASASSAQQDVLQSLRDHLTIDGESLESTQLFFFQEPQNGFLVSDLPCTLAYSLTVQSKDSTVKARVLSRQIQLRAPKEQVAAAVSAVRVYSIAFGARLHNSLTVTLRETKPTPTAASASATTTFDVLVLPNYQNLQLNTPSELVVREGRPYVNLSSISITTPWTRQLASAGVRAYYGPASSDSGDEQFRWSIRTKALSLLYDNFSPLLSSVVHKQFIATELEMRGSIADFHASVSAVSLGLSTELLRDRAFFRGTIERQVVQLTSIPQKRSKIQTLTTSRADSAIAGSFVLGVDLPEGFYSAINVNIPSGVSCSSAPIQCSDDMNAIAAKVLGMACGPALLVGSLFPATTLRVRDTSTPRTNSGGGALSLEFYLMGANNAQPSEFPDLLLDQSSVENSVTHLPLTMNMSPPFADKDPNSSSGTFRISVFGHVTDALPVHADALDVEAAIRELQVDKLDLVSVHRVSSSGRHSGMGYCYNWTIEASHPLLLDVQAVDQQELQASSGIHIQVSRVSRGREVLVGSDTLSLSLSTLDNSMVVARREIPIWVEKTEMELAVRLPISFVSVKRNESVLIDGIVLDSFEGIGLTLQIESRNGGSLALLPKEKQAESTSGSLNTSTLLTLQGSLSELNTVLNTRHLVYSSLANKSPTLLDEIRINLRSASTEAIQVIPVEIVASAEAPTLLLPVTQITAEEEQEVDIRGLKLFFESTSAPGGGVNSVIVNDDDYHLMLRESARIVRIHIQAQVGYLTLSSSSSRHLHETNPERWSLTWKREVEIAGSMRSVSEELSRLRYFASLPPANNSSTSADIDDTITFTTFSVDDGGSPSSSSTVSSKSFHTAVRIRKRPVVVQILFDGGVLSDYDQLSISQGQTVALRNTSVRVVKGGFPGKVKRPQEENATQLDLSISAVYGTFALDANNASSSSALGDFKASLTTPFEVRLLMATTSEINRLLSVLQYVPKRNFNGPDQIVFRIKQAEGTKLSNVLAEEMTGVLSVFVDPVYRLPRWEWKSGGSNVSTLRVATTRPQVLPAFKILDAFDDEDDPQLAATTTNFFEDQMVLRAVVYASIGTFLHDSVPTRSGDGVNASTPGTSVTLEGRVADLRKTLPLVRYQLSIPLSYSSSSSSSSSQARGNQSVTVTFTDISRQFSKNSRQAAAQPETAVVATLLLDIAADGFRNWELDILKRHEISTKEDHAVQIGDALDLSALKDYDSLVEMECVAQTGNLYLLGAAAVNMTNALRITAKDGKSLQKLVSELFYSPNSDFNGFDFVQTRVLEQESELIVRVLPDNDDPKLVWTVNDSNSSSSNRQWFNDPALLLPGLVVEDPDTNDVFDVQIDAANGSLKWRRDVPKELFDGVTMSFASNSSLHLKTTLQRLNSLLTEPQLRFIPKNVSSASPKNGVVRICVHDGTSTACEELKFLIRTFYEVQIVKAQEPLKVFHHRALNLSDVVRINRFRFEPFSQDADEDDKPVILQIDSSTGSVLTNSFDLSCADEYESRSELLGDGDGVTRVIRASGVNCVNAVLATAAYRSNPMDGTNSSVARLRFQLFNTEMELLAVDSLNLQVAFVRSKPRRLVVTAATANGSFSSQPQQTGISWGSDYVKLADYAAVAIQPQPIDAGVTEDRDSELGDVYDLTPGDADLMLELAFACSHCRFFYSEYVPGVSYEFAAAQGTSEMRFIGSESGLNQVLAMLQVDLQKRSRQEEEDDIVQLTLAPYKLLADHRGNSQHGRDLNWNDTSAVPITTTHSSRRKSVLEWRILDTQLVFRDVGRGESVFLHGVALRGDDVSSSNSNLETLELTIWIECVFGSSLISFDSGGGSAKQQLCEPNQPPIAIATTRKHVNRVLSTVQVTPNASFDRVDLQFSCLADDFAPQCVKAPLFSFYFPMMQMQTSASNPILVVKKNWSLHAVEDETIALSDWVAIQGACGARNSSYHPEGFGNEDDDEELFVATLAVQHGTIRVQSDVCCVHIRTTLAGRGVKILGTISTIQTALDGIQYTGDLDFAGNDTLHAAIERFIDEFEVGAMVDSSSSPAAVDVTIFVEPVNDLPARSNNISSNTTMHSLESTEIFDVDEGKSAQVKPEAVPESVNQLESWQLSRNPSIQVSAQIVNGIDAFVIQATSGIPRRLNDFAIRVAGASSATAIAWFKLRLSCERGQLGTMAKSLVSSSEQLESSQRMIWINGTLAHIHEQLQSTVTYFGATRGSSSSSDQSLDHLTFSLFSQTSQEEGEEETTSAESIFLVKLSAPPVIPQLHIANSIEGPFTSSHWQVVNMTLEHGDTLDISGIWVENTNSDSQVNIGDIPGEKGDLITLEVACEYGSLRFSHFDDHLLQKTLDSSGKTIRLALTGGLQLLNQALVGLQYESKELNSFYYRDSDAIRLSVRNDAIAMQPAAPDFKHERMVRISIQPKVLVPCVNLGSLTYFTGYEDTGFRFPELSLGFPDVDNSSKSGSSTTSTRVYYHQLWSTELLDPKAKYQYPRAGKDDGRHRWIQDFPGRAASSSPPTSSVFCANGNVFFFQGSDEAHGRELWVSDGSHAGTRMLLDLVPGPKSSEPSEMALLNNKVLFAASGVDLSWSLGTDSCNGFRASSLYGDKVVYVVSKSSVWTPSADYDCLPGYHWATTAEASQLFPTDEEQQERRGHPQRHNLSEPYVFWSSCQWSGYTFGGVQRKLFRFADSRVSGALKHAGRRDSAPIEVSFATTDFAGIVCIKSGSGSVTGAGVGRELWITDGTTQNTKRVIDLQPGNDESSNPRFLTPFKSSTLLLFQAETHDYGAELYKTDGTATGTILVEDIWRGPRSSSPSSFAEWTAGDGRMYFAATSDNGRELWSTDGFSSFSAERIRKISSGASLVSGTSLVGDICPGNGSSNPRFLIATTLGVFFSADDCVHGRELWITDGSTSGSGTRLVTDLNPGIGEGSNPSHLVLYSGKVYFQAQVSSQFGFELYVSDSTAAGTLLLADIVPGPASSYPSFLSNLLGRDKNGVLMSNALYFSAFDAATKTANMWKSDGSRTGTVPLLDEIFLHERKLRLDASIAGGAVRGIFTFQNAMYYFMESPSSQNRRVLNNDVSYQLIVTVNRGRITTANNILSSSGSVEPIAPASFINVTGSFAELAQVLDGLVYLPEQNWNFHTSISHSGRREGHVVEWLFSVQHGDKVQETYADLLIVPRADAPVIQVPTQLSVEHAYRSMDDFLSSLRLSCLPLQCNEDSPVSLQGLAIRSADDTSSKGGSALSDRFSTLLLSVSLSVLHGKLAFADTKCIGHQLLSFPMESPQQQVAFETDARCVNTVLASATYTGDPNFSGADFLQVHVTDKTSGKSDQVTIPLLVKEINDAPYLVTSSSSGSSSEYYECDEDISLIIRDFHIVDPDIPADLDAIVIELRATFGSLALLQHDGVRLDIDAQQKALILRGTLRNINSALSALVYTSASNWNSMDTSFDDEDDDGFDSITVTVSDNNSPLLLASQSFNSSSTSVRFVYVRPVADPVVISTPGNAPSSDHADEPLGSGIHGDEDTWLQVHNLSFSSVDDTSRLTLIISLAATHGILTLSLSSSSSNTVPGVTFLDNTRNGEKKLRFKGTFASLDKSVRDLGYLPDQNFNGRDQIVATAVSLDEYTLEESQKTTLTIPVQIDAVNDPPIWDISSSATDEITVDAKLPTLIHGAQLRDVDVTDALCSAALGALPEACEMDVVIEVAHGTISLPRLYEEENGESITIDKVHIIVQDPGYLALSGSLERLNYVLREIVFTLDDIETRQTAFRALNEIQLVLTVDDRGTYGKGGPQVSSAVIHLALADGEQQKLRGLSLVASTESVVAIEEDSIFAFDGSITLHDADVALSTAASLLEMTILTPNGAFAIAFGVSVSGIQLVRNDTSTTVLRGFFTQINAALTSGAYFPARDWYGSEQLSISVIDVTRTAAGTSRRASVSLYLAVAPVCDEPTWRSLKEADNGAFATLREDEKLLIDELSLACPDAQADEREVAIQIVVRNGGVMLATYEGLLLLQDTQQFKSVRLVGLSSAAAEESAVTESRLFFSRLEFRGRLQDVNTALKGLIYEPNLHFHSNGGLVEEIELLATAGCGATGLSASPQLSSSSAFTVHLRIQAVNDPPILLSKDFVPFLPSSLDSSSFESLVSSLPPPTVEATEDTDLLLEPLLVQDPDQAPPTGRGAHSELQLVNISCVYCSIRSSTPLSKLLEQHGLFISSTTTTQFTAADNDKQEQSATQVLLAQGCLSVLNSAFLNSLVFKSAANFHGVALIFVWISDLGNSGQGGVLTSTYGTAVRVKRVNDGPQIHLPPYGTLEPLLQVRESSTVLLKGAPSIEELHAEAQHLSSSGRKQTRNWNLMLAQPLAPDSTTRLTSIGTFPGSDAFATSFFTQLGGKILFSGRTELSGDELWQSDGTAAGTTLLKDIYPGPRGSEVSFLITFSADNRVYFAARGPDLSWRVLMDHRDSCESFRQSAFDANVFFAIAQDDTWEPDQVYDCPLGYHWMSTAEAHVIFIGTVAENGHSSEPLAYFDECGWDGYVWGGVTRIYLRFSDSRETGAYKHVGYRDSYRIDRGFQTDAFAGIVCYRDSLGGDSNLQQQQHQIWGPELWATDGTAEGTHRVKRINSNVQGSSPSYFAEFTGLLYFQATSSESGAELWVTDGTRQGTLLVGDIEPGSRGSEPKFLTVFDTHLAFSAATALLGREPWISDGAPRTDFSLDHSHVGTGVLLDICAGPASSNPKYFAELTTGAVGTTSLLLFQADDCVHGAELWVSGGSASTTRLVADICSGRTGSNPSYLTAFASRVYFQADDGVHGKEIWATDGTGAGTLLLVDLAPGVAASAPSFLTVLANLGPAPGHLVFAAQAERDRMWEFWQSDGTQTGTTKLFAGSREVASINGEAMDAMASPRFLSNSGSGSQSFFYFGKQTLVQRSSSFVRSDGGDAVTPVETRSITLVDVEGAGDEDGDAVAQYMLSLNCSKGFLSLGRKCAGDGGDLEFLKGSQTQSSEIALKGSLSSLNCALEQVTYVSKADVSSGWDNIFVTLEQRGASSSSSRLDESGSSGDGRFYAVTKRIPVEIRAINDPPVICMPSTYFAPLDAWADLKGVEVSDADAGDGLVFIQIKVHNGQLRVEREAGKFALNVGLGASVDNSGSGSSSILEFAATVADAALIFQSLQYRCAVESGCRDGMRDYLSVYVDDNSFTGDGGARDATDSVMIHVQSGTAN